MLLFEFETADNNGFISADELHEYAKQQVQATKPLMKPEIYGFRQGIKIVVSRAKVNTELKYLRLVEEKSADNGEISLLGQKFLNLKRKELGLSDEVAIVIENKVLEPFRTRRKSLTLYEQDLEEACKERFPLTEQTLRELKDLQELYGLRDEDIFSIQQKVMTPYVDLQKKLSLRLSRWSFIFMVIAILYGGGVLFFSERSDPPSTTTTSSPPSYLPPPTANPINVITSLNLAKLAKLDTSSENPDVLAMDGSTTMVKLIRDLIDVYRPKSPKLKYGISDDTPSGSNKGLEDLINGTISLAATSRKLNAKEEESGLQSFQIGRDAIGVVVGINNPFKGNLTKKQLQDIYLGAITNWSMVGGTDRPIKVINRFIQSGTRDDFQDIVLSGRDFGSNVVQWDNDETTLVLRHLNGERIDGINEDGINGIYYATVSQLKVQLAIVRIIEIDGMSPTDEAVKSGKYPIIRDLFLAVKKTTSPAAKQFIEFALLPKGQEILEKIGFVPIKSIK